MDFEDIKSVVDRMKKEHQSERNEARAVKSRVLACVLGSEEEVTQAAEKMTEAYISSTFLEIAKYIWRITGDDDRGQVDALRLVGELRKVVVAAAIREMKTSSDYFPQPSLCKVLRSADEE